MPPKTKVLKSDIINTAIDLVRKNGEQALNARNIAAELKCSTQPIFSNFATMEELRNMVIDSTESLYGEYVKREVESGFYPTYKASGMAYIRFAKEEKALFRLLYMRDRSTEVVPEETKLGNQMENLVHINTGLEGVDAKRFHLEMWAFVHGVATMVATGFCHLDWELISRMLTDAYQGLKKQYGMEG